MLASLQSHSLTFEEGKSILQEVEVFRKDDTNSIQQDMKPPAKQMIPVSVKIAEGGLSRR